MIVCIDDNKRVLWLHDDNEVKQLPEYVNDDNVLVVDKELYFKTFPNDGYKYTNVWNSETQEIEHLRGQKIKISHEEVTNQMHNEIGIASSDNLINMDMLLAIDEKLNAIMEHLKL